MFIVTTTVDVTDLRPGDTPVAGHAHREVRCLGRERFVIDIRELRLTPWGAALQARRQRRLGRVSTWGRAA